MFSTEIQKCRLIALVYSCSRKLAIQVKEGDCKRVLLAYSLLRVNAYTVVQRNKIMLTINWYFNIQFIMVTYTRVICFLFTFEYDWPACQQRRKTCLQVCYCTHMGIKVIVSSKGRFLSWLSIPKNDIRM